ncbi:MAG: type 1 glutamine amidotransferase [Pseudomonadota bacterium]
MKPIYIFRHLACEGPGYFAEFLERQQMPYRMVAIDQAEAVPANVDWMSGLVFMGGPMSVNDPLPWIAAEINLIQQAREKRLPVLGHCLGGQLIAKALGARVRANPVAEIGWHAVEKTDTQSTWLTSLPPRFDVFHWHGETFDIPAGATRLLRSDWCENQAFVLDSCLAFQCHVEMTAPMVREWADFNLEALAEPSASVQSHEMIVAALERRVKNLQAIAEAFYLPWLARVRERAADQA